MNQNFKIAASVYGWWHIRLFRIAHKLMLGWPEFVVCNRVTHRSTLVYSSGFHEKYQQECIIPEFR